MKKSKAILLVLCAVLLVAASAMGTLAWLTSEDAVTNTFTVGKVEITLDEAKVNVNGQKLDANNNVYNETGDVELAERVDENTYKLMPGHKYTKDPIIHVARDSEDCYLFVKVENGIEGIEAETVQDGYKSIANQMTENDWEHVEGDIYIYAPDGQPTPVSAGADIIVFGSFAIAGSADGDLLSEYGPMQDGTEGAAIKVTAYAIQSANISATTAQDIWTAGFGASTTTEVTG